MIGTIETKQQQLKDGYFRTGDGPEKMLIIGSCRAVPYLAYLDIWNKRHGRFTISFIDPCNWHWDSRDAWVNYEAAINAKEADPAMLKLLAETQIYIHEHYENYGMFNSSLDAPKNIFQFGLNPQLNICIPNFHDYHLLGQPKEVGLANLERFYANCQRSSFHEMEDYFRANWRTKRFFWTGSHVSKEFTLFIFRLMEAKFLRLGYDEWFWNHIPTLDLFANTPMPVTADDISNYDLQWTP